MNAPGAELRSGIVTLSPGSLSYRREDDPGQGAQYAVIEDGQAHFRTEPYDTGPILERIRGMSLDARAKGLALWFYGQREG